MNASAIKFWTRGRSERIAICVLLAFGVALILTAVTDKAHTSSLMRGDFPAFYAAAKLVKNGRAAELYSFPAQAEIERENWPSLGDAYLAFVYPPYVAFLLTPLAALGPLTAKLVFTVVNVAALLVAFHFARRIFPQLNDSLVAFTLLLSFGPLFSGLLGGQNIAISLMLYVLLIYFLLHDSPWRAGLVVGLLFFKPHLAALFLFCLLLTRSFKTVFAAAGVLAAYFGLAVLVSGPEWLAVWLAAVKKFSILDFHANGHQMVSLHAFALKFLQGMNASSVAVGFANLFVMLLTILILVPIFVGAWRIGRLKAIAPAEYRAQLGMLLVALGPTVVLSSVHALYYDLCLALPAFLLSVRLNSDRHRGLLVLLWVLIFLLTIFRQELSWQPLLVFGLWAYLRAIKQVINRAPLVVENL